MANETNIQAAADSAQANLPAVLAASALVDLGLQPDDVPAIREIADRISVTEPMSVSEFGRDIAEHASSYADELLDQVRNKDLDEMGSKLTQVVSVATNLNMHALSDQRSKLPLVGPLLDKFRLSKTNFLGKFETTKDQIDRLVSEIERTQGGLSERNESLNTMFAAVREEHHMLGMHIAAGRLKLEELRQQADELRAQADSPTKVQDVADMDHLISNLDIRVGSLVALQQSAFQTLPQIRIVQANNEILADKFHTVKTITVPLWKRQFVLALGLNEQRNAVALSDAIDDRTNQLMRDQAALLHKNAVQTAKANQRLVIDIDTLQKVQDTLVRTVQDVLKIQRDGVQKRAEAERKIIGMRKDMQARLAGSASQSA